VVVSISGVARSWLEIDETRLAANYRALVRVAGSSSGEGTDVLAVVKANAYGHGAERCAVALVLAGAKWLGVANADEGVRVRGELQRFGLDAEILVMCGLLREDVHAVVEHRLTPVVWTAEHVEWLRGIGARVHVEIETGMGRQGVQPGVELEGVLDAIAAAGLVMDGVMTHFAAAEVADGVLTLQQEQRFAAAVEQVISRGLKLSWVHAGASSSVDNPVGDGGWLVDLARRAGAGAMVRCGIALYGYCLPIAGAGESQVRPQLQPVMTWKTRVIDVRDLAAGEAIGYNATYTAATAMRVALLPVGYSDGLRRELSSTNERAGGWVIMQGRRANILGRVSMNLTAVDVTGHDAVRVGDEVVMLGDGVTADDHGRLAGTISYDILCGMGAVTATSSSQL
jgi:alanine racemase